MFYVTPGFALVGFLFRHEIAGMKFVARIVVGLFVAAMGNALADLPANPVEEYGVGPPLRAHVTTVAQLQSLSSEELMRGCDFSLTGVLTLVDPLRELVVLQDESGAVAIHFPFAQQQLQVGQRATLTGTNACPGFMPFPAFPQHPSGKQILSSFEFPMSPEQYRMSRVRGYLRPPATGDYNFWIASDNSSELWLSTGDDPAKARKIASIQRFGWANPREWNRYPSQASDPIPLQAGVLYYLEALQEQTTGGEHLDVAWQGPDFGRRIIDAAHLVPWQDIGSTDRETTNGLLREYWTNYLVGDLAGMGGARPYEALLTVPTVQVRVSGPGEWPKPDLVGFGQRLPARNNFRWVQVEGVVKFQTSDHQFVYLELSDGQAQMQVRAAITNAGTLRHVGNALVRVTGVCEGVSEQKGFVTPQMIWAAGENCITFAPAEAKVPDRGQVPPAATPSEPAVQGFYSTRGVVTFNGRFSGKEYLFVQENNAPAFVRLEDESFRHHFTVGNQVDMGGALDASQSLPIIVPLVVTDLGLHSMPEPVVLGPGLSSQDLREGRWCELEGVVQAVSDEGLLTVATPDSQAYLWIGQTPGNFFAGYVDARIRARGVVLLNLLGAPVLLSPARSFVEVQTEAPANAFDLPYHRVADLLAEDSTPVAHRVHVAGVVTYLERHTFYLQDASGGIRVHADQPPPVEIGEPVEVVAFPVQDGAARFLARAQVQQAAPPTQPIRPRELDLTDPLSGRQNCNLVQVNATLLTQKTNGGQQVLELQQQQRVFVATLTSELGQLPEVEPGSQLRVIGVCEDDSHGTNAETEKSSRNQSLAALHLLLRTPADVIVLHGPPWWTWRRTALLVGTLVLVSVVALGWVHLLRRRLERQQAAQLAFSRQVLKRLEDDRRRIAVNLHDSLGQILLLIKNHALVALQPVPDEKGSQHRLNEISTATSQAIEEVREITHGLRPYQLDRLGLTQAIRTSVQQAAVDKSISFACRVQDVDGLFDQDTEIHVYRIVQEAVTNVVKHAAATEATVVVKRRPDSVSLSIRDNGRGFEAAQLAVQPHGLGYGLTGISERARILGATMTIDSHPGSGTSLTVDIHLPIRKL